MFHNNIVKIPENLNNEIYWMSAYLTYKFQYNL